jgi:hypothetical protein
MIASSLQMRLVIIATNGPVDDLQAADDQLIAATVIEQPRCHFAAVKAPPLWPDSGNVDHLMQDVAARIRILALDHCPSIVTVLNCPRPRAGLSVRYRRLKPSSLQEASLRQIAATQVPYTAAPQTRDEMQAAIGTAAAREFDPRMQPLLTRLRRRPSFIFPDSSSTAAVANAEL